MENTKHIELTEYQKCEMDMLKDIKKALKHGGSNMGTGVNANDATTLLALGGGYNRCGGGFFNNNGCGDGGAVLYQMNKETRDAADRNAILAGMSQNSQTATLTEQGTMINQANNARFFALESGQDVMKAELNAVSAKIDQRAIDDLRDKLHAAQTKEIIDNQAITKSACNIPLSTCGGVIPATTASASSNGNELQIVINAIQNIEGRLSRFESTAK